MINYRSRKSFSAAYIRFHRQVLALHEGKINTVKKLAEQAREELAIKMNLRQLRLRLNN